MSIPINNLALFSLAFLFGITMITEGFLIVKLQRQLVPLPSKILYWIGAGVIGKEKSAQKFAGKNTPENLHTYAVVTLMFGATLIISSLIYLNWMLSQ
jgi:hypothetical protein